MHTKVRRLELLSKHSVEVLIERIVLCLALITERERTRHSIVIE